MIIGRTTEDHKMHGSRRVVIFCLLTTVLPSLLIVLPLYLRNIKYADVMYKISDSDVIQIHKGQSSVFCERHSLKMNSTFNAFQMKGRPELSNKKKHIRMRKSMNLPDDTLEYWGFYLFKGAVVELKACSRYEGSKLLVVKGDKILNTCGILEGDKRKNPIIVPSQDHVIAVLENPHEKDKPIQDLIREDNFKDEFKLEGNNFIEESIELQSLNNATEKVRFKRSTGKPLHNPNTVLDAGVYHGGNAINSTTNEPHDDSVSSFETNLFECYHDNMLLSNVFPYSIQCNNTDYLETTTTLKVIHNVTTDGYYYYVFYSDNDFVKNDIYIIFDIYKPTFQYVNMSASKVCINKTECVFDVGFLSDELVIVEVPTREGLTEDVDNSILVSICHPRVSIYIIFPISVIILVLLFAFL